MSKSRSGSDRFVWQPILVAAACVIPIAASAWIVGFMRSDWQVKYAMQLNSTLDTDEAIDQVRQALGFRDKYDYRHIVGLDFARPGFERGRGTAGEKAFDDAHRCRCTCKRFPDLAAMRDYTRLLKTAEDRLRSEVTGPNRRPHGTNGR